MTILGSGDGRRSLAALADLIAQCNADLREKPGDSLLTFMRCHFEARAAELKRALKQAV